MKRTILANLELREIQGVCFLLKILPNAVLPKTPYV